MYSYQSFLLFLSPEQGHQRNTLHSHHFEPDARNISLGLPLLTKPSHQHLVVLGQVVQAPVPRHEGSHLLPVLFEHDSDSLSDSRVGLLGLDTDFFDNEAFGHAAAHEWIFESRSEQSSVVFLIVPSGVKRGITSGVSFWLRVSYQLEYLLAFLHPLIKYYYFIK